MRPRDVVYSTCYVLQFLCVCLYFTLLIDFIFLMQVMVDVNPVNQGWVLCTCAWMKDKAYFIHSLSIPPIRSWGASCFTDASQIIHNDVMACKSVCVLDILNKHVRYALFVSYVHTCSITLWGTAFSLWGQMWLVSSCLHMQNGMKVPQECHTRGFPLWQTVLDFNFSLHCYCLTLFFHIYILSVYTLPQYTNFTLSLKRQLPKNKPMFSPAQLLSKKGLNECLASVNITAVR